MEYRGWRAGDLLQLMDETKSRVLSMAKPCSPSDYRLYCTFRYPTAATRTMSGSPSAYRDRIYIVKDIIIKLLEYGELNQTALVSFCGLNLTKHKHILDELEANGLISRAEKVVGKRTITVFGQTQKGVEFCRNILEPYERMFPRKKDADAKSNNKVGMLLILV